MIRISKLISPFIFPTLVLMAHGIASKVLNLYAVFPSLDIPFHFLGGFSIAYTAARVLAALEKERVTAVLNRGVFLVLVIALTATATVLWEFAEFLGDRLLETNIQISLANTMQDQFFGILGGMAWLCLSYREK